MKLILALNLIASQCQPKNRSEVQSHLVKIMAADWFADAISVKVINILCSLIIMLAIFEFRVVIDEDGEKGKKLSHIFQDYPHTFRSRFCRLIQFHFSSSVVSFSSQRISRCCVWTFFLVVFSRRLLSVVFCLYHAHDNLHLINSQPA